MMKTISISPVDAIRFSSRIVVCPSGCYEWAGGISQKGYGVFYVGSKMYAAHRYAYTLWAGPIDEGLLVCHKCDNRKCLNIKHLFLGTVQDNNKDRDIKGRNVSHGGDKHYARISPEKLARGNGKGWRHVV
jgi:hypothetical protein